MMKKESVRALQQRMEMEICRLFGETSYRLVKKPCRGKYHGHNDYTLVFNSGRELFISLGYRGYMEKLQKELDAIRHFRAHQAENSARITAFLRVHQSPYERAQVEILPHSDNNHYFLYAVVIISTPNGNQYFYRTTEMHHYLIGRDYKDFSRCLKHLLQDSSGEMEYTHPMTEQDKLIGGTPWTISQNSK